MKPMPVFPRTPSWAGQCHRSKCRGRRVVAKDSKARVYLSALCRKHHNEVVKRTGNIGDIEVDD